MSNSHAMLEEMLFTNGFWREIPQIVRFLYYARQTCRYKYATRDKDVLRAKDEAVKRAMELYQETIETYGICEHGVQDLGEI